MKTKLGLSVGALGALVYLVTLFGGYIPLILVAGYILLLEEDDWLRRMAGKALVLTVTLSALSFIISIIPGIFGVLNDVLSLFNTYFYPEFIAEIVSLLSSIVNFVKNIALLVLGIKALSKTTIYIPVVDDIVNKVF